MMTPADRSSSPAGPASLRLLLASKSPERRKGAVMPSRRQSLAVSST